jgi:hypothetical protein
VLALLAAILATAAWFKSRALRGLRLSKLIEQQ